jgi:predicted O-methyltransferase YrrM
VSLKDWLYPSTGLPVKPAPVIDAPPAERSYAISPALGAFLAGCVRTGRRNVLELGAGQSSVVFAEALRPDGRLTSLEQSPEWCAKPWEKVEATGIDSLLIPVTLRFGWRPFPCHRYTVSLAQRGPFDLVLVDAPQWYYGRDGALPLIAPYLAQNALIVVDDAGRHQEQWAIQRWLQTYRGLTLETNDPTFGRNGVAVLRANGLIERPNLGSWVSGLVHAGINMVVRAGRSTSPSAEPCQERS